MSFPDLSAEKHYSVAEVHQLWSLCRDKVRQLFENEPGVLKIGHADRRGKRKYVSLRIPESVLRRVHAKLHGQVAR